jgi:hypothetical protein
MWFDDNLEKRLKKPVAAALVARSLGKLSEKKFSLELNTHGVNVSTVQAGLMIVLPEKCAEIQPEFLRLTVGPATLNALSLFDKKTATEPKRGLIDSRIIVKVLKEELEKLR